MRTLARATGISLGSVQQALQDLDHRGYLTDGVTGRTRLRRRDDLITQWTAAFANRLLPSLETRHAIGPVPTQRSGALAGTKCRHDHGRGQSARPDPSRQHHDLRSSIREQQLKALVQGLTTDY